MIEKLLDNWRRFKNENPDISEAIKEGYEVAVFDEETECVMCVVVEEGTLKLKIIEDGYIIPAQNQ